MGKVITLAECVEKARQKPHDYSWCIQWFRTFAELAGDTISAQRMMILLTVAECDPYGIDQGELASVLGMDKSVLSRSLQALLKYVPPTRNGAETPLVEITTGEADRRRRVVRLTRRGKALISKLYGEGESNGDEKRG